MKKTVILFASTISLMLLSISTSAQDALSSPKAVAVSKAETKTLAKSPFEMPFITVNNEVIYQAEMLQYVSQQNRGRFYHGKPPEEELLATYQEFANDLILMRLARAQAQILDLTVDDKVIADKVSNYSEKHQSQANWATIKINFLPMYERLITNELYFEQLEQVTKASVVLTEQQARAYYVAHPEKFTEPPQNRVSVIFIGVASNASGFVWQAAKGQLDSITEKLTQGHDFGELAELHSTDPSADNLGDMGFLHQGMTSTIVEETLKTMKVGEITEPLRLLDGAAIFKLTERKPEIFHSFDEVKERAMALALREAKESAWQQMQVELKESVEITIDESFFENLN